MKNERHKHASMLFPIVILFICAQALPSCEPWQVQDQSYCEYWLRHFDAIYQLEKETIEAKDRLGFKGRPRW